MTLAAIISKVWSFCTTLRDDGVGYGNYLKQIIDNLEAGLTSFSQECPVWKLQ